MSLNIIVPSDTIALEICQVGSTFERVPNGWKVRWVDGGTVLNLAGETITLALSNHGLQVVYPLTPAQKSAAEQVAEDRKAADAEAKAKADAKLAAAKKADAAAIAATAKAHAAEAIPPVPPQFGGPVVVHPPTFGSDPAPVTAAFVPPEDTR